MQTGARILKYNWRIYSIITFGLLICWVGVTIPLVLVSATASHRTDKSNPGQTSEPIDQVRIFLPLVARPGLLLPRVNIPLLNTDAKYAEFAIFWFGKITPTDNYADVRIGYNSSHLIVCITVFDRLLWRDPEPSVDDLTSWDAADIYLDLNPNTSEIDQETYRFVGQLNWWEPRQGYQAVFQGSASGWETTQIPFETASGWRGNAPNDDRVDHGWLLIYNIPFNSLGLSSAPEQGSIWRLGVTLHDRDDQAGTSIPTKYWPEDMQINRPETWSTLHFGLPNAQPSQVTPEGSTIIRQGENGANVPDAMVGGAMNCGEEFQNRWTEWGLANYSGSEQINIQNEEDVSDWVCFSKYYITFPLDNLPAGKEIISASLRLHSIGNAGGGSWGPAPDSLIQVLTIGEDWTENTINWNNAPLVVENVGRARVAPIVGYPGPPGVPHDWDLTYAVRQAYSQGKPLRLVLYSADVAYHTGKYFSSSDLRDSDPTGRPTLLVVWGDRPGLR
jgi:hypothetical protein